MAIFGIGRKRTLSRKMPANASRTTARKAYATAVANERRTIPQRVNESAGSWGSPKITKKKTGSSSLKIAGQSAMRQARGNNAASTGWDRTRNAFKAR